MARTSISLIAGAICVALAFPAAASMNISSAPTKNVACSAGVCTPTAKGAILNAADLQSMLAASDVTVNTGSGAVTIEITAPLAWASAHRLTLNASFNVSVKAVVAVEGTAGLTVNYSNGGDLLFFPGGKIDFWDANSSLIVNGTSHVLVNDIASMAAAYTADNSAILALAKDYDAGPDGTYNANAVSAPMTGTFEGLGHTISNFSAAGAGLNIGFFGQVSGGSIRDITLSNAHVASTAQGTFNHPVFVGVLAPSAGGTNIIGVHASGTAAGLTYSNVGGLLGERGVFIRSDSSVAVTCGKLSHAGGLAGAGGSFLLSHASGTVTVGTHSAGGGLTGADPGYEAITIVQSYATGDVTSTNPRNSVVLGGLAGAVLDTSSITDSYALGAVRNAGVSELGGLLGYGFDNAVKNAYAAGAVGSSTASRHRKYFGTGGFLGFAQAIDRQNYVNDYWDVDTSTQTVGCGDAKHGGCAKPVGLSDAQLKSQLPTGFDPAIWAQSASINNGYPYLIANPPQ